MHRSILFAILVGSASITATVGIALANNVTATPNASPVDPSEFLGVDIMRPLLDRNWTLLGANRLMTWTYVRQIVEKLEAPDAYYRMTQVAELELDPMLGRVMDTQFITDEHLLNSTMGMGFDMLLGGVMPFVEERRENMENGSINPAGEMAALAAGMIGGAHNMGGLVAQAEYDAKVLMLMAQTDMPRFRTVYAAIRDYVYEGM